LRHALPGMRRKHHNGRSGSMDRRLLLLALSVPSWTPPVQTCKWTPSSYLHQEPAPPAIT
jgi:hypothetical protein